MADIIDLDFYRKFRVILPVRGTTHSQVVKKERTYESGYHAKPFRRKRKLDLDSKITKKD